MYVYCWMFIIASSLIFQLFDSDIKVIYVFYFICMFFSSYVVDRSIIWPRCYGHSCLFIVACLLLKVMLIFPLFDPGFRVINVFTMLHVYCGMFIFTCLLQQVGRYFQCLNHMLRSIMYWLLSVYCDMFIDTRSLIIPLFDPDV